MDVLARLLRDLAAEIQRTVEGGITFERLDVLTTMAERALRAFVIVIAARPTTLIENGVTALQTVVYNLNRIASSLDDQVLELYEPYGYHPPVMFSGTRGRPKIVITEGMLRYFFSNGFSASNTSMLLQVSLSTLRRRMREYGILVRDRYSDISDEELDRIVTSIQHRNPNCGYRMMQGYLSRLGHRIQQSRIRRAMIRTDPEGVISRWCYSVQRRCYSVSSPNTLWHIDGHHRLIRYCYNYLPSSLALIFCAIYY